MPKRIKSRLYHETSAKQKREAVERHKLPPSVKELASRQKESSMPTSDEIMAEVDADLEEFWNNPDSPEARAKVSPYTIALRDLIVSEYMKVMHADMLAGKCAYCGKKIPENMEVAPEGWVRYVDKDGNDVALNCGCHK